MRWKVAPSLPVLQNAAAPLPFFQACGTQRAGASRCVTRQARGFAKRTRQATGNGLSTIGDVLRRRSFIPFIAQPQSGATGRRHVARHPRLDSGGGRFGQDPGADHPHCLAAAKRLRLARRYLGRDLHQQGGQGNAHAPVGHAAGECARHVDWHVSRLVQPLFAHPLPAGQPAFDVSDSGHPRPAFSHQAAVQAVQNR